MPKDAYAQLYRILAQRLPSQRLIMDPMRTLAFGTDASFYRLIPKLVVLTTNEAEVAYTLRAADSLDLPVTFRAAGTSLSGQAVSDSVLLVANHPWRGCEVIEQGRKIRLQPGVVGADANKRLAPFNRKIGPDPASINSAMIGGIVANNASGMCCGTAQNAYQTVASMRVVLQDGSILDSAEPQSREAFRQQHPALLENLMHLGRKVRGNPLLAQRIKQKYKIKNTTGYSLNALVDFEDPLDMLIHLMVGSEGTLGFVSEIVLHTVPEHPFKASALMIFPHIEGASSAAAVLKSGPVAAVEMMDRASLRSVENKAGMPSMIKGLSDTATALLVETRAFDPSALADNVMEIGHLLGCAPSPEQGRFSDSSQNTVENPLQCAATVFPVRFTQQEHEYARLWNVRKGLFPSVGAVRQVGTTVVIEDVAFPIERLAPATLALQALLRKHRYDEAIIFGHALEGNLHFVFTPDFQRPKEVDRYRFFMDEVCHMVVKDFDGSLKAEHGTGRNMAPFVELEWGHEAYALMTEIKALFDPRNLLNPGVILNANPDVHVQNLKPLPPAHATIDRCTECGFCEVVCPSRDLSLTPRQRIVAQREMARLRREEGRHSPRLKRFEDDYVYWGEKTCAADGMCATRCPVDINTGDHTRDIRHAKAAHSPYRYVAALLARNFSRVSALARLGLQAAHLARGLVGARDLEKISAQTYRLSHGRIPRWLPSMPSAAPRLQQTLRPSPRGTKIVYFPSCVGRTMGHAPEDPRQESLHTVVQRVLERAGYQLMLPDHPDQLCCGMAFESKGYVEQADEMARRLENQLMLASKQGQYPILCDMSPCVERMRRSLSAQLKLYDQVGFIDSFLMNRLKFTRLPEKAAFHITCSAYSMGLESAFKRVAQACVQEAVFPDAVSCCGFAGDKGLRLPELNASALAQLKSAVAGCSVGYSNSRTCEIGLTYHGEIVYQSIFYLVDRSTRGPG